MGGEQSIPSKLKVTNKMLAGWSLIHQQFLDGDCCGNSIPVNSFDKPEKTSSIHESETKTNTQIEII